MFDLTGTKVLFKWGTEQQTAFDKLWESITSTPVLTFADDFKPFRVKADSLDFATGAVLGFVSTIRLRWEMAHHCILFQKFECSGEKLWDPWQGNVSHHTCMRQRSGLIIKTWSILWQPRNSTNGRPTGPSICHDLNSPCITAQDKVWENRMPFPDDLIMEMAVGTTTTSHCWNPNCSPFKHYCRRRRMRHPTGN